MHDDLQQRRDSALRKIERNVVNFQRLEVALKSLIPAISMAGTLNDLALAPARRARELKKKALGEVASAFHAEVLGPPASTSPTTSPDLAYLTVELRLESDSLDVQERKRALIALVRERNRLIHSQLSEFNLDSVEDCGRLSALLDEQNPRICAYLEFLALLRSSQVAAALELKAFVDSDEFLELLARSNDGG